MENNPLLNKLNQKYNPDIVKKFEMMNKIRNEAINVKKTNEFVDRKNNIQPPQKLKMNDFEISRKEQDLNFSKIFSKDNYIKNKLIYERRNEQVKQIAAKLQLNTNYDELKNK